MEQSDFPLCYLSRLLADCFLRQDPSTNRHPIWHSLIRAGYISSTFFVTPLPLASFCTLLRGISLMEAFLSVEVAKRTLSEIIDRRRTEASGPRSTFKSLQQHFWLTSCSVSTPQPISQPSLTPLSALNFIAHALKNFIPMNHRASSQLPKPS